MLWLNLEGSEQREKPEGEPMTRRPMTGPGPASSPSRLPALWRVSPCLGRSLACSLASSAVGARAGRAEKLRGAMHLLGGQRRSSPGPHCGSRPAPASASGSPPCLHPLSTLWLCLDSSCSIAFQPLVSSVTSLAHFSSALGTQLTGGVSLRSPALRPPAGPPTLLYRWLGWPRSLSLPCSLADHRFSHPLSS